MQIPCILLRHLELDKDLKSSSMSLRVSLKCIHFGDRFAQAENREEHQHPALSVEEKMIS
jgi:hypothetical protein